MLGLTETYRGRNHHVFCDNFFTSPRLFTELHEHGLYACGTVRQTQREFPANLRNVGLTRGEGVFRQCNISRHSSGKTSDKSCPHCRSQGKQRRCHGGREMGPE